MSDDELDDRLRGGLRSITAAAGAPPAWADAVGTHAPRAGSVWRVGAAMAAVVVVVVAGLVLITRSSDDLADGAPGQPSLFRTSWWLESVTANGVALDVGSRSDMRWEFAEHAECDEGPTACVPGPRVFGIDGCNAFERAARFDDGTATWGDWYFSTLMACLGEVPDAFTALMRADSFRYTITGDRLVLSGGGTELTFTTMADPLGTPRGTVLDAGRVGDTDYRLTWDRGVGFEWLDHESPSAHLNTIGLGDEQGGGLWGTFADLGSGAAYLIAILPDAATSATFTTADGSAIDLTVFDADPNGTRVVGHVFEDAPDAGTLAALDLAGNLVDEMGWDDDHLPLTAPPTTYVTDPPTAASTTAPSRLSP